MIKLKMVKFIIILLFVTISCAQQKNDQMKNVLVITGGHEYEPTFYKIFDSFEDVKYDTILQPRFNERLKDNITDEYDVLVFYDMWQLVNEEEKKSYIELLQKGKGMVFLHHSLVSYQQWDEFEKIIGGKYIEKDFNNDPKAMGSTYTHDINMEIKIVDRNHPVTRNIDDFLINDEGYQFVNMSQDVHPLLSVSHPDCTPTVGWTNHYGNSNIVYILLGHGPFAHENSNYRKLIHNSINWVAEIK